MTDRTEQKPPHPVDVGRAARPRSKALAVGRRAARLLEEAKRYLIGGVNSPVRTFRQVGGEPLVLVRGEGATVTDAQGRTFIDLIMGWGTLLLGHNHPSVLRAVRRQVATGIQFGLTHPSEVDLARAIVECIPSIAQVRFTTSGTEACMTAVRLARAWTKRSKVLLFEGCYHGHSDGLLIKRGGVKPTSLVALGSPKSAGIPESTAQEALVVPFGDVSAAEEAIAHHGRDLACAVVEPVPANMGVVTPPDGFLMRLRHLTREHGIILIFDEVVTGFRIGLGGAQARLEINPDLTVLGKIIGGGFPIGAVGGPQHLMQQLAPEGTVYHAGTFAGHPVAMAAGLAAILELRARPPYERLEELGRQLAERLRDEAEKAGISIQINRMGSMFTVFFSDSPVRNLSDVQRTQRDRFARWSQALRRRGVLVSPSAFEASFLSVAHTEKVIDQVVQASADGFRTMA